MGNGSSKNSSNRSGMFGKRTGKPRVVLESPQSSNTEVTRPRVSFAFARSGNDAIKARPKMADVGTLHTDIYKSGRIRYQRNQTTSIGSNTNMTDSFTSIRSNASGPVDGNWEPTIDPYERTNTLQESQNHGNYSRNNLFNYNESAKRYNHYYGFVERDYQYNNEIQNGLARVDEI
ncbi:hypothetical protein ACF0H5_002858 [Mactra antiquata]